MVDVKIGMTPSDETFENIIESYLKSKSVQKMWNYFLEIIRKDFFIDTVQALRKKYNIPENGFETKDKSYTRPPRNVGHEQEKSLRQEVVEKICKKYKLHYFDYSDIILDIIYYNYLHPIYGLGSGGLFWVSDIIEEKEEPFNEFIQQSDDDCYPVAIRISPYATQRDLIDFIKNKSIWKNEIEFSLKKYRDKNIQIGKVRRKKTNIQERNDLIYSNSHKPVKEIRKILAKQGNFLDDGHISKIVSLERKKRKEV